MRLFVFSLLALTAGISLRAADQRGAENTKRPASVEIVSANAAKASPHPIGNPDPIGNVQVTYADGTKDLWTTKGNCSLAHVGSNGTVGWTVNGPADIELHDADTGKLIESVQAFGGNLPTWAKPYEDK